MNNHSINVITSYSASSDSQKTNHHQTSSDPQNTKQTSSDPQKTKVKPMLTDRVINIVAEQPSFVRILM